MNSTIKTPGPLISPDQQYQTSLGTFTRFELYNRYAQTVQGCLCLAAPDYTPYYGAELIMRAVIAMLDPAGVKNDSRYFSRKLGSGFNAIGYQLVPANNVQKPTALIPQLYLGINCRFPNDGNRYKDDRTGKPIGQQGLLHYLDIIDACLAHSESYQYDRAARYLVKAVRILAEPEPDSHTREVETLLWNAAREFGYQLEVVEWYREMFGG